MPTDKGIDKLINTTIDDREFQVVFGVLSDQCQFLPFFHGDFVQPAVHVESILDVCNVFVSEPINHILCRC
jgi:hypothetical protein